MADYSISQLTEDLTAADSDVVEVAKDNGDGTFTSRKQLRSTLLADKANQSDLDAHEADTANPHSVTKAQVGLANADDTADADKPVSSATQTALDAKANTTHSHTASQVTDFDTEVANNAAVTANTAKNSYPSADATKLAGIEAGAEVNDVSTADIADFETTTELNARDTANRSRTNHTGSQPISTVTGLQAELDGKSADGHAHDDRYYTEAETDTALALKAEASDVPATIVESVVAGTNVTVDDTDPANPVVSASGGGEGGGAVDSINGETGVVVLDADDIDDASTTHKFTTAGDASKLAGIETGATADQTGTEIKTAYEAEADTNAYTDSEKSKLAGIESGAEVNEVGSADIADFETTTELNVRDTANRDRTNHTGTQTASTISDFDTEVSNNTDVAANTAKISFDSVSSTKLAGIEAGADVTDATNVAASGAVMNSGDETVAGVKTFSSSPIVPAPTTDLQAATKKYVDDNAGGGGMSNPMTTEGDIILGGASGAATRLAIGTEGQVPTVNASGTLEYATPSGGGSSGGGLAFENRINWLYVPHSASHIIDTEGAVTLTDDAGLTINVTGGTSNSWAEMKGTKGPQFNTAGGFDRGIKGRAITYQIHHDMSQYHFKLAWGTTYAGTSTITGLAHIRSLGFRSNGVSALNAFSSDGSASTETDVLASLNTGSSAKEWLATHTAATNQKFYYDGTLLATHTTNIASGTGASMVFVAGTTGTSAGFTTQIGLMELEMENAI